MRWPHWILSAVLLLTLCAVLPSVWHFLVTDAVFFGKARPDCLSVRGACWPLVTSAWPLIVYHGLTVSVGTAVGAFVLSLPLALYWGMRRYYGSTLVGWCIELIRGLPTVVVLFSAAVVLPSLFPSEWLPNKYWRIFFGLSLFQAAYLAEVIRGGLLAVPQGIIEAGRALGLPARVLFAQVIAPIALRNALPGMVNCFLGLLKDTSLLMLAGITDFLGVIEALASNPAQTVPQGAATVYVFAALAYGALCAVPATAAHWCEKRFARAKEAV